MAAITGNFLVTSTGVTTIDTLPFTPSTVLFKIASKYGVTENDANRRGDGWLSDEHQGTHCSLTNPNGYWTRNYRQYCIANLSTQSGSIYRSFSAEGSIVTDGFELDVDRCEFSYDIDFIAIE